MSDLEDPGSLSPRNWSDAGSGSHYSNTGSGPLSDNDLDSGSEASGPVVESNHGDDSHTYNTASDVDGYSAVENNHSDSNNNDSDESQDSPSYGESGEEQQDSKYGHSSKQFLLVLRHKVSETLLGFYSALAQLTTDPCSFLWWSPVFCCQKETQAKALITLERSYFADLFALF